MKLERTLILVKPDGIARRLAGEILSRFERKGLRLVALKLMKVNMQTARRHYAPHKHKPFFKDLIQYVTSGPIVAMVWEGDEAIAVTRTLIGSTFGVDAAPGTIRGDYAVGRGLNLVHGSDSVSAARREIPIFFKRGELVGYSMADEPVIYQQGR